MRVTTGTEKNYIIRTCETWVDDEILDGKHVDDAVRERVQSSTTVYVPDNDLLVRPATDEDVLSLQSSANSSLDEVRMASELSTQSFRATIPGPDVLVPRTGKHRIILLAADSNTGHRCTRSAETGTAGVMILEAMSAQAYTFGRNHCQSKDTHVHVDPAHSAGGFCDEDG